MANPYKGASGSFWGLYSQGRPRLSESVLQRIWEYHTSNGGSFEVVHEPGAGIGLHTERLAERFQHVIVSDTERSSLDIATTRLRGLKNAEYRLARFENAARLPRAGIDMVVAIDMTHFTETDKMLEAVHRQLKPGGTFAVILVGPSKLEEAAAQNIWKRIWWSNLEAVTQPTIGGKVRDHSWLDRFVNGLDGIPLPEHMFEPGAVRIHINTAGDWHDEIMPPGLQFDKAPSQSDQSDHVLHIEENENLRFTTDIFGLREQLAAMSPAGLSTKIEKSLEELDRSLNGRKVSGHFLVQCLLATKRR
ncbi:uncharacterized protein RHO25_006156 [Cercospora beticola]|uniref:Methyltransferase domain-containing protein n=1 Tax=Cercospora beticola TaxID=122368 RepID=A0ABZ0NPX3_CERBT|nr:hypothetical protein RHO25_006156 [Cercospora beticola]CAK1363679.1 unnamed protein product [Cercospora beticola]